MFFNAMESISNICKKVVSLAHKFKQGRMPSDESFLLLIIYVKYDTFLGNYYWLS